VESISDDRREKQALELWRRWDSLDRRDTGGSAERANEALRKLANFCILEIADVFKQHDPLLTPRGSNSSEIRHTLAFKGVQKAAATLRDESGRKILDHVRSCVAGVLAAYEVEQQERLGTLMPEQVLQSVLRMSRYDRARLLDLLSPTQRNGIMILAYERLQARGVPLSLALGQEPKDSFLWIIWYLGRLYVVDSAPLAANIVLLIDTTGELNPPPKNKPGAPIDLLGPLHVRAFKELSRMMSMRPDSDVRAEHGSDKNLARSLGVGASVIRRWKKHPEWNLLPEPQRTEDVISYAFGLEDVLRSARIAKGDKRGPKPS
jgi:hypothetical protein